MICDNYNSIFIRHTRVIKYIDDVEVDGTLARTTH